VIFTYNENGCKDVIKFYSKRLENIKNDISFLERERDSATELEARFAIEEALAKSQYDRASTEIKIKELEQHLNSAQKQ
jgi:hypothetical protein